MAGIYWQLEYCAALAPEASWLPAENPRTGSDYFIEVIHALAPDAPRFYRVTGTPLPPP